MRKDRNLKLLVVNYHYIRNRNQYPYPGIHPLERKEFYKQAHWLKNRFYMVSPEEVEKFIYGEGSLPGQSVFLTFDDGLKEHSWVAKEILGPLQIKGAFFVSSRPLMEGRATIVHKIHWLRATTPPNEFRKQFFNLLPDDWQHNVLDNKMIEEALRTYIYDTPQDAKLKYLINFHLPMAIVDSISSEILKLRGISEPAFCKQFYMNESQLRNLVDNGHVVGSHGHSHTAFSRLDAEVLKKELQTNISYIDKITGVKPRWLSYPYGTNGSIPKNAEQLCQEFSFRIGFALDKKHKRWNTCQESPYRLDRVNTNDVEELCNK